MALRRDMAASTPLGKLPQRMHMALSIESCAEVILHRWSRFRSVFKIGAFLLFGHRFWHVLYLG
eukprot:8246206-Pyramimonas_sp.AAC.1